MIASTYGLATITITIIFKMTSQRDNDANATKRNEGIAIIVIKFE